MDLPLPPRWVRRLLITPAVWLFGASIVAMVLTGLYSYVLTDGLALMGTGGAIFTAVIWLIAFSLFFYARAMARCGVLR